jgi:hypothetical protein
MNKLLLLLFVSAVLLTLSCRKNSFITGKDASVLFSADTLFFDTVFVSTGSVTQSVKIINGNDQKLHLSSVRLMGGSQSYFNINIDGSPGPVQSNIDLDAGDSIYIFVAVQINPGSASLPFVVQDSIQVSFNGNQQYIQLQAWGQNAHFLRNQVLTGNNSWDSTLPYVILGGLRVDTGAMLTIPAGCRIYFHADAPLLVDGSLRVNGLPSDSTRVYFQGDRLDEPYRDYPGSWPGIFFRGTSTGNQLQSAVIRNAYQAIVAESLPAGATPGLVLGGCIIDNSYNTGILGVQGSVQATNCLISNCGQNIELGGGGNYQFIQCTAVSYSNNFIVHTLPVLSVADAVMQGTAIITGNLQANFTNCIFWGAYGNVTDEVMVSRQGTSPFAVNFTNCLWKVQTVPSNISATAMLANMDPLFDSVNNSNNYYDFHLRAGSPALGKGASAGVTGDLDGNPRPAVSPDLGCYQR